MINCTYTTMWKSQKQLPNLLKRIETNVVPIVFNYVPFHARAILLRLLILVLHESGSRWRQKQIPGILNKKCDDSMIRLMHLSVCKCIIKRLWPYRKMNITNCYFKKDVSNDIKRLRKTTLLMLIIIDAYESCSCILLYIIM